MAFDRCKDAEIISFMPSQDYSTVQNPYFQFNKGLTQGLKLSETFCKPLRGLHLMQ
jgi:hypothetical protein